MKGLRWQPLAWQAAILLIVALLGYSAATTAYFNLENQKIATGWGFLGQVAGFAISQTLISYSEVSTYLDAFVVGLLNTLLASAVCIVLATLLGFLIGIGRLSQNWLIARLALGYVEFVRNVPLVLQLVFWYTAVLVPLPAPRLSLNIAETFFLNNRGLFIPRPVSEDLRFIVIAIVVAGLLSLALGLHARRFKEKTGRALPVWRPSLAFLVVLPVSAWLVSGKPFAFDYPRLQGFNFVGGLQLLPEFVALVLGLTLYTAAFIAEIVRAGLQAVSKGQQEAALALGLSRNKTLRFVVVPQALRIIVPPLTNQYLNLVKNSSLAVAIGYPELFTVAGTINNQTGQAVEVIAITMSVYLTLSLLISAAMNFYDARKTWQVQQ